MLNLEDFEAESGSTVQDQSTKQVILTRGLPASGKTTWAKQMLADHPGQYKRINKDDLRAMLDGGKWGKANEKFVLRARDSLILQALSSGYDVIVDDTNLHPRHERRIRQLVNGQAEVVIQDFTEVPLEECIRRDQVRPNYVGERVIRQMYNQFLWKAPVKAPDIEEPAPLIVTDLHGILVHLNGRDQSNTETCEQDDLKNCLTAQPGKMGDQDRQYRLTL